MAKAGLMGQATGRFLGVNLRQDRISLADDDVARAINADFHTQPGVILRRLGRTRQFSTALTSLEVRRLAKINNGRRYQVAGTSVFRDQVSILTGLSSNHVTTMVPFRPLNDTATWMFIADDGLMRKDDGTTVRNWGIAAFGTISVGDGITTGLTGTYSARVTGVRLVGSAVAAEGNPSTASANEVLTAQDFCYGDLIHTDAQVNGFGLYRTAASGSAYLLDRRQAIAATTKSTGQTWEAGYSIDTLMLQWSLDKGSGSRVTQTWEVATDFTGTAEDTVGRRGTHEWEITDAHVTTQTKRYALSSTKADTALSTALETDNTVPPTASWGFEFQEHMFLCRDASNQHYLWWSKRFRPEQVPAANFLEIGSPNDPLQCGVSFAGMAGVFSRLSKYRILGNVTSGFVAQEALSRRGTPAPNAVVPTESGVFFPARDGFFVTNFTAADQELSNPIEPLFFGETVNEFAPINWTYANKFSTAYWKGRVYFAYVSTFSTTPDMIAVYSMDTQRWYFFDHPLRSLFVEEDQDDLVGGTLTGYVTIVEDGSTDEGTSPSLTVETRDLVGQEGPLIAKLYQYIQIEADTLGDTLTVKFYVDDVLKRTTTFSNNGRTTKLLPVPAGSFGHRCRIRFEYTGGNRVRIYGASALYMPLVAA